MISLNGGYAMIKYNSTQEELQIAYRSKKPVLCYDENRRAHWAVIEETATESVDEETQEPIIIYEYSYRLIDEASGGGKLYRHELKISNAYYFEIYNNEATPITITILRQKYRGTYSLIYPNSTDYSTDIRLNTSLVIDSSTDFKIYGFKIVKETLSITSQLNLTLNPSGNVLTDTVTEV